ncbi:MAG TPA: glycoside hydrolase family 130 protein [Acidimicrobiia bacterium]|nr:glycoside hydrolase family 130 protein [Acidimicrobiia bacterium]
MAEPYHYRDPGVVARHPNNPILTNENVPYPSTLVYNAGVVRFGDRYVMVFRNDFGFASDRVGHKFESINLGLATSADGIEWEVHPRPVLEELKSPENIWAYDPRLSVIDGRCYLSFCLDTRHGMRAGIAVTDDLESFDLISLSGPDLRNVVLFPEKVQDHYVRLERPFPIYLRRTWGEVDRFDIWISDSPDLVHWGNTDLLLTVEQVPFANEKVGPGPPPVKTDRGWLTIFHAVDVDAERGKAGWEDIWTKRYTAGVMLLDLDDPHRVVGLSPEPLMVPTATYEMEGFRNQIIFPTGLILETDGELKIYYGAADSVICLGTADLDTLLDRCVAQVEQTSVQGSVSGSLAHQHLSP